MPSASALAKISKSRLVDWSPPAAPPMDGSKSSVTSTTVPSTESEGRNRRAGETGVGHAQRSGDAGLHLVDPGPAGDLLDDVAQDDVVGVRVVVRSARLAEPSGRFGDGDLLGRRPLSLGLGPSRRLIEVLAEPAGVVEELAGRDPIRPRQVGDVAVDAGVQVEAALVGELQHDDGDERLGGAADVPRHVGIDGTARRVERRRARARLADRAVRCAHRDARPDELTRRLVVGEDGLQLRLARRIGRHHDWRAVVVTGGAAVDGGAAVVASTTLGFVGAAGVGVARGGALVSATVSVGAALPSSSDEHAAMPSRAPTTASDAAVAASRRRRGV